MGRSKSRVLQPAAQILSLRPRTGRNPSFSPPHESNWPADWLSGRRTWVGSPELPRPPASDRPVPAPPSALVRCARRPSADFMLSGPVTGSRLWHCLGLGAATVVGVGECTRGSKMRDGASLTTYSRRFLRAHRPNPTQRRNDGQADKAGHQALGT